MLYAEESEILFYSIQFYLKMVTWKPNNQYLRFSIWTRIIWWKISIVLLELMTTKIARSKGMIVFVFFQINLQDLLLKEYIAV